MQQTLWSFLGESVSEELQVWDLFCGLGGFSTGAELAGHEVVVAADSDKRALVWHKKNHPRCWHVKATLPDDEDKLQLPSPESCKCWHLHGSPPCTKLSAAKWEKTEQELEASLSLVRWFFALAMRRKPTSWSFEQVAVKRVVRECEEFQRRNPKTFAFAIVQCSDYGIPQVRRRVIAGTPCLVHGLVGKARQLPRMVSSVAHWTPARRSHTQYPKWKRGKKILRAGNGLLIMPATGPGYTIVGSHLNYWCDADGHNKTIFNTRESARLQTFPETTKLPRNTVVAQRLVGNAVPVRLAQLLLETRRERCESPCANL